MPIIQTVIKGKEPVIDALSVTPSTSPQQITAPQGTDGYSPVNVSAVTSSIDANIVAGNIKKDVQILGVTGSYEGTTPTGTKSITANGVYDVTNYASADVQVPTTAPAYYIEYSKDGSNVLRKGTSFINMSGLDDIGAYALYYAYAYGSAPATVDLSGFTHITGSTAMSFCFYYNTGVTSVDLSNLVEAGNTTFSGAFQGCSNLTGSLNLGSLTTVGNGAFNEAFQLTKITSVDLSGLVYISYTNAFTRAFAGCTNLTSANISNLEYCFGGSVFQNCFSQSGLTSLSFPKLRFSDNGNMFSNVCNSNTSFVSFSAPKYLTTGSNVSQAVFSNAFSGNTSMTSADFSSLYSVEGRQVFSNAFKNTALTSLSFPSLAKIGTSYTNQFNNMLSGVTGCTVHFPSNLQSVIGSWSDVTAGFGGTNTTVLFDIVSQITVNSTTYDQFSPLTTDNYRAWIDPTSNITVGGVVYTFSDIYIGTKSTTERIIMYQWTNGSTSRYTTTATPTTSDTAYEYANISGTGSTYAITATDVDVIYTALGTPAVNDTAYGDEGITSVGTITAVA